MKIFLSLFLLFSLVSCSVNLIRNNVSISSDEYYISIVDKLAAEEVKVSPSLLGRRARQENQIESHNLASRIYQGFTILIGAEVNPSSSEPTSVDGLYDALEDNGSDHQVSIKTATIISESQFLDTLDFGFIENLYSEGFDSFGPLSKYEVEINDNTGDFDSDIMDV